MSDTAQVEISRILGSLDDTQRVDNKGVTSWADKQDVYYDLHKLGRLVQRDPRKHNRRFALCEFIVRRRVGFKEAKKELVFIKMNGKDIEEILQLCFGTWQGIPDVGERRRCWLTSFMTIRKGHQVWNR